MTVIRPNSITGVTSITAQGDTLTLHSSDGTLLNELQTNINASSGVSTVANLNVIGGSVGIGTTNPTEKLEVSGKIRIETGDPSPGLIIRDSDTNGDIEFYQYNSGDLQIINNATSRNIIFQTHDGTSVGERLRIDSSGKVGIGTDTGTTRALRVKAPSNNSAHISLIDTDSTQEIWQVGNQADGDAFMQLLTDEGTPVVKFDASGVNYINGGNVGINTNNPGAKLHVYGNSASEVVTLTDGATITPDFSTGNNFTVTLGGNRTLANPTNTTVGQSGVIYIVQDGTGSRTLGVGTHWHFPAGTAPTLTTTGGSVDVFAFSVRSSTSVVANAILDVKVTA